MKCFAVLAVATLALIGLSGCQTSTVTTTWKSPDPAPAQPFKKIVAMVVNATPGERRAAEDELARQIHIAQGVPAYSVIPDTDVKDREKIKSILVNNGFDGAVVIRLIASDQTTTYVPPTYDYGARDRYSLYGQGYVEAPMYRAGYTVTDVVIRAEINVYSVEDGRLLWSGSSGTTNPANVQDLISQVANATRGELRKQGMLR